MTYNLTIYYGRMVSWMCGGPKAEGRLGLSTSVNLEYLESLIQATGVSLVRVL